MKDAKCANYKHDCLDSAIELAFGLVHEIKGLSLNSEFQYTAEETGRESNETKALVGNNRQVLGGGKAADIAA